MKISPPPVVPPFHQRGAARRVSHGCGPRPLALPIYLVHDDVLCVCGRKSCRQARGRGCAAVGVVTGNPGEGWTEIEIACRIGRLTDAGTTSGRR